MRTLRHQKIVMPKLQFGLKGFFTVELIEAKTGRVKRRLEFQNLMTDAGLNALGSGTQLETLINSYMAVGTGSTIPANGDTALVTEVGPSSTNRSNSNGGIAEVFGSGPSFAYWYRRITRNFSETQANGNLTELGLFTTVTAGTMFARQLFKDALGSATTITKTNIDQLRVTYELRVYSPVGDTTVSPVTISGSNYSVTTRAVGINTDRNWGYDGTAFGLMYLFRNLAITGSCMASDVLLSATATHAGIVSFDPSSTTRSVYVPGDFYIDLTLVWDPGAANPVGGIGSVFISLANGKSFQQAFTPKLPKDNTKRLTIVNRVSWGRYP